MGTDAIQTPRGPLVAAVTAMLVVIFLSNSAAAQSRASIQLAGLGITFTEWAIPDTRVHVTDDLDFDVTVSWPIGYPILGNEFLQLYPFIEPQYQFNAGEWRLLAGSELTFHPSDRGSRYEPLFGVMGGGMANFELETGYFAGASIGVGKLQRNEINVSFALSGRRYWMGEDVWNDATFDVKFAIWLF